MPPDVFLMLASSGITLVASLMFFVSEDAAPVAPRVDPKNHVNFCLPPRRLRLQPQPPPLPRPLTPWCEVNFTETSVMTLKPSATGEDWELTLDVVPLPDAPAIQVEAGAPNTAVHDLRWFGRAGVPKAVRRTWRQKPGRA